MQRLLRTLILALSLIAASACTRLADKDSLADAVVISPAMQDVSLSLKSAEKLAFGLNPVRMNQTTMSSANYFRLVDDLKTLGRLQGDDALIGLAGKIGRAHV